MRRGVWSAHRAAVCVVVGWVLVSTPSWAQGGMPEGVDDSDGWSDAELRMIAQNEVSAMERERMFSGVATLGVGALTLGGLGAVAAFDERNQGIYLITGLGVLPLLAVASFSSFQKAEMELELELLLEDEQVDHRELSRLYARIEHQKRREREEGSVLLGVGGLSIIGMGSYLAYLADQNPDGPNTTFVRGVGLSYIGIGAVLTSMALYGWFVPTEQERRAKAFREGIHPDDVSQVMIIPTVGVDMESGTGQAGVIVRW